MKKILLVDDEFALMDTLRDFLEDEGYLVETADNGKDALEAMAQSRPDLVITDIMMPIMDGKAMLRAMHDDPGLSPIPVVLMCSVRREVAVPPGEDLPATAAFLRKPFKLDELLETVARRIGPGHPGREQ
jgi:CheY-like chemotaxis protein